LVIVVLPIGAVWHAFEKAGNYPLTVGTHKPENGSAVTGQLFVNEVNRIGVIGDGLWQGADGVWRFDDQTTYHFSEESIRALSSTANRPQPDKTSGGSLGTPVVSG
jgi:hypothetical protein